MFDQAFIDQIANAVAERIAIPQAPTTRARYLRLEDAAAYMGETAESLRHVLKQRLIPVAKVNRKQQWIDTEDIDAFMRKHKQ